MSEGGCVQDGREALSKGGSRSCAPVQRRSRVRASTKGDQGELLERSWEHRAVCQIPQFYTEVAKNIFITL